MNRDRRLFKLILSPEFGEQKIRAAADKRDVSLNVIVNSAMAQWLTKRGLVEIRPL